MVAHGRLAHGQEKTGYATQKPEGIVRRMVQASTRPGDWVLDFFAGSGTLASVAAKLDRRFVVADVSPDAVGVIRQRLSGKGGVAPQREVSYRSLGSPP